MEFVPRFWFLTNFKKPTEQGLSRNFMKTLFKKLFVLFLILTTFSCSEDGATGATGQAGADGNANVIGTTDFTILPTDWQTLGNLKYINLQNNGITQSIVNSGIVMVYQKSNTGNSYTALPFSYQGIDRGFTFGLNYLQITLSPYNNSSISITANTTIRAVIIPASNRMANPNVNWNNYQEVKDALKLKD